MVMEAAPKDPAAEAVEEEATKKNTDCVYFLASPFTCKKGSECEYRHSDVARMNPRDCWYWLNSNCLNPKCSFRHPPLDAFLGNKSATTFGVSPVASSQPATSLPAPVLAPIQGKAAGAAPSQVPGKQSVPCYYFQHGYCMKGDRCPFMHGPQSAAGLTPATTAPPQTIAAAAGDEPAQPHLTVVGTLQKCSTQYQIPQTSRARIVKADAEPIKKPVVKRNTVPDLIQDQRAVIPEPVNDFSANGNTGGSLSSHLLKSEDEQYSNGLEAGEILGESSPGFDVLVDHSEDEEYYRDEEEFGQNLDHGGRQLSSVNENHKRRYIDLDAEFERDRYSLYAASNPGHDRVDWEHSNHPSTHRRSSERYSARESRGLRRPRSPERVGRSDLRHKLSKHRKIDGVDRSDLRRSDHVGNYRKEEREQINDRRYESRPVRDQQLLSRKNITSNRLQGRLKLPEAASNEKRMDRRRLSPTQPNLMEEVQPFNGRIRQSVDAERRNKREEPAHEKDDMNNIVGFAGPKSLAQLKVGKVIERKEFLTGKGNNSTVDIRSEHTLDTLGTDSVPFEGPKPLSEILKRKRETGLVDDGSKPISGEPKNQVESGEKRTSEASIYLEKNVVPGDLTVSGPERSGLSSEQDLRKGNDLAVVDEDQAEEEQGEEGEEYEYYEEGDEEYEYYEEAEAGDEELEQYDGMDVDEEYLDDGEEGDAFPSKTNTVTQ